jgi:SAM-dependent methyltransferase
VSRDYSRFDGYVNRLTQDVYAQPPDEGHLLWGLQAIHTLFSIPQRCKTVLDIGCGQGQFKGALEWMGLAWTGVNIGEDYAIAKAAGLNVEQADMTFLPFADASFDLVFARHVLEHSPFPVITLMEWRRVCSGWMALVLPAPAFWKVRGRNHYSVLPKENWLWLLERAGWHPLHEYTMTTDDEVFLRAWQAALPPEPGVDVEYRFLCERTEEVTT